VLEIWGEREEKGPKGRRTEKRHKSYGFKYKRKKKKTLNRTNDFKLRSPPYGEGLDLEYYEEGLAQSTQRGAISF